MKVTNIWKDDDDEILEACQRYTEAIEAEKKIVKSKKVVKPTRKYTFKDGRISFASQVRDYQERMRLSTGIEIPYNQARIKVNQIIANEKRRNDKITENRRKYTVAVQAKENYENFDSDSETVALDN